eukprot:scaffold194453_cov36-Prasinocladus_malaysianus.AAC.1
MGRKNKHKRGIASICSAYAASSTVAVLELVAAKLGWALLERPEAGAGTTQPTAFNSENFIWLMAQFIGT